MPAGYSISNKERKKIVRMHDGGMKYTDIACVLALSKSSVYNICREETYRRHNRNAVFRYEEAKKANQAIHPEDIDKLKRETYIGRTVVIKQKSYESDGVRATGMTGIDEKKAHVCSMYRDFFNVIMARGGYQTSIRWADMLCHHADYDIAFEG